ncbi:MAG: hypothetical protein AB7F86_15355 [Bdellovibrionales bacterium]
MNQRIQSIEVAQDSYIYAQDDVLLKRSSLDPQLASLKDSYKTDLRRSKWYEGFAVAALIVQAAALGIGLSRANATDSLAWIGGSAVVGLAVGLPLAGKASRLRYGVVEDYNQSLTRSK